MASPQFYFAGYGPGEDASVAAGGSVVATLDSLDGVRQVEWTVVGVDETTDTDDYTLTPSGFLGSVATTTAGVAGTAAVLRCKINAGVDPVTGNTSESMQTTLTWWVPTATGLRVKALGEDATATVRDVETVNASVRAVDAGGGGSGASVAKLSVRAAATGNVSDLAACPVSQDGVTLSAGQRILLAYQTTASQNGIYTLGTVGGGTAPLTRATDFDTSAEALKGAQVSVEEGTANGGSVWLHATTGSITLGSTSLVFRQISSRGDSVALTDANQTLTVGGGRRYLQSTALTAVRSKTLSTTGAVSGDVVTIEKLDGSAFPMSVINGGAGGGVLAIMAGPKDSASFRFDGTNWSKERALPDTSTWPVFNVRDFGAKGDERFSDFAGESAAIQSAIDAAAAWCRDSHNGGAVVEFPPGAYFISTPLILRRTPYYSPICYRGAGRLASQIKTITSDAFVVETLAQNPDITHGGNQHVFEDLGVYAPYGYSIFWDLGDTGDAQGDPIRPRFHIHRCFFSRTMYPGAALRFRRPSRLRVENCEFDPFNYAGGIIGLEVVRGSFSMKDCIGGGALVRARETGETHIIGCRNEGAWGIPGVDFLNSFNITMLNVSSEGHGEADAMYRFTDCKDVILENVLPANSDYSYVVMRKSVSVTGTPTIVFSNTPAVGNLYLAENKLVRSAGSWQADGIGPGSRVKITNAVTNTDWMDVLECNHLELWVSQTVASETVMSATGLGASVRADGTGVPTITFSSSGNTITRSEGSWVVDGFEVGQTITRTGSLLNVAPLTVIEPLTDTVMTVSETLADDGPLSNKFFTADEYIGGIVFRNTWVFDVRGAGSSNFTQYGRFGIEVDENCRNGRVDYWSNGTEDNVSIDPDAVNCHGESRAVYFTEPDSANPSLSNHFPHGRHYIAELDLTDASILPLRTTQSGDPSSFCGIVVRRDTDPSVGLYYDESTLAWHSAYSTNDTSVSAYADFYAKRFIGTASDNTRIVAHSGQSVVLDFTNSTLGDTSGFLFQRNGSTYLLMSVFDDWLIQGTGYINFEPAGEAYYKAGTTWYGYASTTLFMQATSTQTDVHQVTPLASPDTGTGITTDRNGQVRRAIHKRTFAYTAFSAAATSKKIVFDVLPAKTKVCAVYCDTTTPFTGGGVATATMRVGTVDDENGYIASHDVLSGVVTKGLADADLGTYITRANAVQGGHIPSWSATKALYVQLDTDINTSNLTAGTVVVVVEVEYLS